MRLLFSAVLLFFIQHLLISKTNVILVMTDDQGWGQVGYMNHPILKTPNLDKMANNGLCFNRFYAGGPVCSPTRATVLTGRTHDRTGVFNHGYALRLQEKTLSKALKKAGYATGHFGKWHLNGLRGPGVPILESYPNGPKDFGFEKWVSVTNFFDLNPIMSRNGNFEEFSGDSSEIIVDEALSFIDDQKRKETPFFCVVWFGTPHSPFMALEKDRDDFAHLDETSSNHYAELKAMDRSIGSLRKGLRKLSLEKNTIVWFMSDNGGLPKINPPTTGALRDFKGSLYEGGIRVPCIIEWPKGISECRKTNYPAGAVDVFPTIAEIVGLSKDSWLNPQDGVSLVKLFNEELPFRKKPLVFSSNDRMAVIDNHWKLVSLPGKNGPKLELYDLSKDPSETTNLKEKEVPVFNNLLRLIKSSRTSIQESVKGKDYELKTVKEQPPRIFWTEVKSYEKYFNNWKNRPEYKRLNNRQK